MTMSPSKSPSSTTSTTTGTTERPSSVSELISDLEGTDIVVVVAAKRQDNQMTTEGFRPLIPTGVVFSAIPTHYYFRVQEQRLYYTATNMMIGKSIPEYLFIKTAIAALRLIAPLSVLYIAWMLLAPHDLTRTPFHSCLLIYAAIEVTFFTCVYLPRRYHLQKAAQHPTLSREERQALFRKCSEFLGSAEYPSGWFFQSRDFHRNNVREWLLWALFSASTSVPREEWEDELAEYMTTVEEALGQSLPEGYNEDTPCMRLTLDPVCMTHRPLLWYCIVGIVDVVTTLRLYWHGFRHYSDKRLFQSFPLRPLTLFSRSSNVQGFSYWYRPHRSSERNPVLFLHGIGVGLYPYSAFLTDLASHHPDIGIIVPEFLFISSRITSPPLPRPATLSAIAQILDTHAFTRVVVAAHSYGTALTAQLLRSPLSPRITATLLVDPIPILLHLPDVAFNFVYRAPRSANEWLLWYFASRDPDVAHALGRHFFWAENVLWREELEGKVVAVALSGQDQVVNSEAVWRYLTRGEQGEPEDRDEQGSSQHWRRWGRGGSDLEVLWYPELDHAMIFNVRKRWMRLMPVLDRFVHLID